MIKIARSQFSRFTLSTNLLLLLLCAFCTTHIGSNILAHVHQTLDVFVCVFVCMFNDWRSFGEKINTSQSPEKGAAR